MIEGYDVQLPQTNIIYVKVRDAAAFVAALGERGVRSHATSPDSLRLVTHLDVDDAGIEQAIKAFQELRPQA
jgi:threonine aldolase